MVKQAVKDMCCMIYIIKISKSEGEADNTSPVGSHDLWQVTGPKPDSYFKIFIDS